jgi:RNA polymerase sigma-70 factor (ECF subfamily)
MGAPSGTDAADARQALADQLAAVAGGNRAALAEVYRLTAAKLFGVCLRILAERSEAEDVLQDVYLTVWQRAGTYDPGRASPMTWLIAIARNKSIDRLRAGGVLRRAGPIELAESLSDPSAGALDALEASEERRRLFGCLEELDPQQRGAIRTAFLDGWTYEQIAVAQGVPLGTMKSWVRRGLMKLKACLER